MFFLLHLLSSSTRRRFYPQRSSGQAVVTGSNVASSGSRAFRESFFYARKSPNEYVHSVRIELEIDFSRHEDNLPSHRGRRGMKSNNRGLPGTM